MDLHEAIKKYEDADQEQHRLQLEYTTRAKAILSYVQEDLDDLDAEVKPMLDAATDAVAAAHEEVKKAIVESGHSERGQRFHFIYKKGAITWDGEMLKGMAEIIEDLKKAQKVGQPSVSVVRLRDVVK